MIEGTGSPAEINIYDSDFVIMRTALEANTACLLVADIDWGSAFAHLYGTYALLPAHERALIRGFALNRFRGELLSCFLIDELGVVDARSLVKIEPAHSPFLPRDGFLIVVFS